MSKKRERRSITGSSSFFTSLFFIILISMQTTDLVGQAEDFKQSVEALKNDHRDRYDLKYLNISEPDLGMINNTFPSWKDAFMLKAKEKRENNLGNRSYEKFYFNVYVYESLKDRQYALKDWMEDFLEGQSIRPGRDMRTYDYASPTIILINDLEIIVLNYKCSDYSDDNFEYWLDQLTQYFGEDNTMLVEVLCGGPLKWTKNAPDPRTTRGLF